LYGHILRSISSYDSSPIMPTCRNPKIPLWLPSRKSNSDRSVMTWFGVAQLWLCTSTGETGKRGISIHWYDMIGCFGMFWSFFLFQGLFCHRRSENLFVRISQIVVGSIGECVHPQVVFRLDGCLSSQTDVKGAET